MNLYQILKGRPDRAALLFKNWGLEGKQFTHENFRDAVVIFKQPFVNDATKLSGFCGFDTPDWMQVFFGAGNMLVNPKNPAATQTENPEKKILGLPVVMFVLIVIAVLLFVFFMLRK